MASFQIHANMTDLSSFKAQWPIVLVTGLVMYAATRCVYNLYFHALSKYPGPRLAAVSNVWWAYHWLRGKYPWSIAEVLEEYGQTPGLSTPSRMETHSWTDWLDLGQGEDGVQWERNPAKHREIRKRLSPTFSVQSLNSKEPTLHRHIDYFVERMREIGAAQDGIELRQWTDWLALDISADMAYSREMKQMQTMNFFLAVNAVTKKFRLLAPLKFLFVPPSLIATLPQTLALNHKEVVTRIQRRGNTSHLDYFEHLCPPNGPEPNEKELKHMETVAVAHLKILNACLMETLRITVIGANGLPRISPGANVDGHYIEKGIIVQYGHFAFTRSPRYFHRPGEFLPQRWFPRGHSHWDPAFANGAREAFSPFSRGPRNCPGMGSAWRQTRLFIAKTLWNFDVERLPGEEIVFDRDFRSYAMYNTYFPTYLSIQDLITERNEDTDFFDSGSTEQITVNENRAAFAKYRIRPRVLRDVSGADTSVDVFGRKIPFPLCISPAGIQGMAHPDGELATSRACAKFGINMGVSSFSNFSVEDVVAAGREVGPIAHAMQLYTMKDRALQERIIRRAEAAGCTAILLTADSPVLGVRYNEWRNDFRTPAGLAFPMLEKTTEMIQAQTHDDGFVTFNSDAHSWAQEIPWLRSKTKMEIWIKGILTEEDVLLARQYGCDGVLVSNHGGRQLDWAPATLDALPECIKAADGKIPVHVDGGFRTGADIFKAIALGAQCCWIGRPTIWGLAYDGQKGVEKTLQIFYDDFRSISWHCSLGRTIGTIVGVNLEALNDDSL
ncbi:hypothetical protein G7054_g5244 [Neopestalotiopsis clavispora]|nr:hypothetical protein G7054_g5244 [Neopestalotiopsis clavispora]